MFEVDQTVRYMSDQGTQRWALILSVQEEDGINWYTLEDDETGEQFEMSEDAIQIHN